MTPPAICAESSNRLPNTLPIFTPAVQKKQVKRPIRATAVQISTLPAIAREIPTARASMEVHVAFLFLCEPFLQHIGADQTQQDKGYPVINSANDIREQRPQKESD